MKAQKFSITVCLLIILCMILGASAADPINIDSMSTDELIDLRNNIDAILLKRNDSGIIKLDIGQYKVGTDIEPGTYYIATEMDEDGSIDVGIYESESSFIEIYKKRIFATTPPEKILLQEGNVLGITTWSGKLRLKKTPFTSEEIGGNSKPEGTRVPSGIYIGGKDIPVGHYSVYSGENDEVLLLIFLSEKEYESYYSTGSVGEILSVGFLEPTEIQINEGNVINLSGTVIMKYNGALNFD